MCLTVKVAKIIQVVTTGLFAKVLAWPVPELDHSGQHYDTAELLLLYCKRLSWTFVRFVAMRPDVFCMLQGTLV